MPRARLRRTPDRGALPTVYPYKPARLSSLDGIDLSSGTGDQDVMFPWQFGIDSPNKSLVPRAAPELNHSHPSGNVTAAALEPLGRARSIPKVGTSTSTHE